MSTRPPQRRTVGAVALIAAAFIAGVFFYPMFTTPTPGGSSWIAVTNLADSYNSEAAQIIADAYNIKVKDWTSIYYHQFGLNILVVGGSDSVSVYEPMLRRLNLFTWNAYVRREDDGSWSVVTPNAIYNSKHADYGIIARKYHPLLRRWTLAIIGYSGECTVALAKYAASHPEVFGRAYTVFKLENGRLSVVEVST